MEDSNIVAHLAAELRALREAVAELAVVQAEGLNAMIEFTQRSDAESRVRYTYSGHTQAISAKEIRGRVIAAAERSLAIASSLADHDDG